MLIATLGVACGAASAQVGTGTFTWRLSLDDGATWQSGTVDAPLSQQRVRVRAVAAWEGPGVGYAFHNALFDATWNSQVTAGLGDIASDPLRVPPFSSGSSFQTLGAMRFGSVLKIDDTRDTSAPGLGSRWVETSQLAPGFGAPFSTANPAVVFTYTVTLDGTLGDRTSGAVFRDFGIPDRFMPVYLLFGGTNRPLMTHNIVTLRVIPSPGAFVLLSVLPFASRRRRAHSSGLTNNPVANFG